MASPYTFTKKSHKEPYESISPLRPQLSQAGKTVLITGGSDGIGLAIAKAFIQASATKVIIIGRRQERIDTALSSLSQFVTQDAKTHVSGRSCNMANPSEAQRLWEDLGNEGIAVDVLVLNAATVSTQQTILDRGTKGIWEDYAMNVRAQLDFAERFHKQQGAGAKGPKYLVHVSTHAIHDWNAASQQPGYGLTKNGGVAVLQQIAKDVPPETMQILIFNPGPNLTQAARDAGYTQDDFHWNNPDLSGQFAVWAASPEAKFLHGRFVWSEWDVDELQTGEIRRNIDEDAFFLKVGVKGL